ncbi:zinc-ribbon domain-containing protein [Escherichia coli]
MTKLTHDEQVAAIAKVNPDIEVIGKIVNNKTKVLCRCKTCGHKWSAIPNNLKNGHGCPKCWVLKMVQARKLSHEEQVAAIAKVNPDVEVLGEITGTHKKALFRCKVCNHKWMATPGRIKCGVGCPKCAVFKVKQKLTLSHYDQVAAIEKVNPDIEVFGEIKNSKTKVLCRCKVCGHEWFPIPNSLKMGHGCPKCAGNIKLSHKEQVAAIAKVNPDIEVIGEIINDRTKVLCRCKVCDHEWSPTPSDIKNGHGCPKCAKCGFLSYDHGKLYIMVDDLELPTQMKIGVSVKENERRNRVFKSARKAGVRMTDLQVVKTWNGPTEIMQEIESKMHDAFSDYKINFPVKFDGSTEFFYYRPEVFDMVEEAYKEIVCCQ